MSKYPLDPTVVSILFDIKDEKASIEAFSKLEDLIKNLTVNTLYEAVQTSSIADDVKKLGESEETMDQFLTNPEVQKAMSSKEVATQLNAEIEEFINKIYVDNYPQMPEERKQVLREYVAEVQQVEAEATVSLLEELEKSN